MAERLVGTIKLLDDTHALIVGPADEMFFMYLSELKDSNLRVDSRVSFTCKDSAKKLRYATDVQAAAAYGAGKGKGAGKGNAPEVHGGGKGKEPAKGSPPAKPPCIHFARGHCKEGDQCNYLHPAPVGTPCIHFSRGHCREGDQCKFLHAAPAPMAPQVGTPCIHFSRGHCRDGDRCKYLHAAPGQGRTAVQDEGKGAVDDASALKQQNARLKAENEALKAKLQASSSSEPLQMVPWKAIQAAVQGAPVIGQGGFGCVYRAKWGSTPAAIKVMDTASDLDLAETRDLFFKELQALAMCRHPNIVQLLAASHGGAKNFALVCELAPHGDLLDKLQAPHLPWPVRLAYLRGIARGLDFLHQRGMVHRDIKPNNILIFAGDVAKLGDMGLTRFCPVVPGMKPRPMTVAGTAGYMAPECAAGTFSAASDVWAFGVMLLQLLCRRPVPDNNMIAALFGNQRLPVTDDVPPPTTKALLNEARGGLQLNPLKRAKIHDILQALERAA